MEKYGFTVLIEQDEDGVYIGSVPSLKSCYTQALTVEELMPRIREAIELCLDAENDFVQNNFVGVQQMVVMR
jgi:predicted RNase H-like HicB family nuclease